MNTYFEKYCFSISTALAAMEITTLNSEHLNPDAGFSAFCKLSEEVSKTERKQYLVGNGASAAFANHMALDWTKNGGIPTHTFSDPALLTAMGNDLGYEKVFSAPLRWYAKKGDLLVTISSSGNSKNILNTIEMARSKEMKVVTISGLNPDNESRRRGDLNFYVPAKTYGIVECAHQIILHVWLDKYMGISEWNQLSYQNMNGQKTESPD